MKLIILDYSTNTVIITSVKDPNVTTHDEIIDYIKDTYNLDEGVVTYMAVDDNSKLTFEID